MHQAQAAVREYRLVPLGLKHDDLPGRHVQHCRAALTAVWREIKLRKQLPVLIVKGGQLKEAQLVRQADSTACAVGSVQAVYNAVVKVIVCAAVVGEKAVGAWHTEAAKLVQPGAEKQPFTPVDAVECKPAVGKALIFQRPCAVKRLLAEYFVGCRVDELHRCGTGVVISAAHGKSRTIR